MQVARRTVPAQSCSGPSTGSRRAPDPAQWRSSSRAVSSFPDLRPAGRTWRRLRPERFRPVPSRRGPGRRAGGQNGLQLGGLSGLGQAGREVRRCCAGAITERREQDQGEGSVAELTSNLLGQGQAVHFRASRIQDCHVESRIVTSRKSAGRAPGPRGRTRRLSAACPRPGSGGRGSADWLDCRRR